MVLNAFLYIPWQKHVKTVCFATIMLNGWNQRNTTKRVGTLAPLCTLLCNLCTYSGQALVCSERRNISKLRFIEPRAKAGIIQFIFLFCLNLWKSLSNFVRHPKPLASDPMCCCTDSDQIHKLISNYSDLKSCHWPDIHYILQHDILVKSYESVVLINVWCTRLKKKKVIAPNGNALHHKKTTDSFEKQHKTHILKLFLCMYFIICLIGLRVGDFFFATHRCRCGTAASLGKSNLMMWQLDIRVQTLPRWCYTKHMFHHCLHILYEWQNDGIITCHVQMFRLLNDFASTHLHHQKRGIRF